MDVGDFDWLAALPLQANVASWISAQLLIGTIDWIFFMKSPFLLEITLGMEFIQFLGTLYDLRHKN